MLLFPNKNKKDVVQKDFGVDGTGLFARTTPVPPSFSGIRPNNVNSTKKGPSFLFANPVFTQDQRVVGDTTREQISSQQLR